MDTRTLQGASDQFDDIMQIEPLGDHDQDCLNEIRAVLARHDKLDRFGVCLLHSHFPIGPDEILLEDSDSRTRCLTIRPAKLADIDPDDVIVTNWSLAGKALQVCTKKEHANEGNAMQALQACTKKQHVSGSGELQALQACTKKQHVSDA